MPYLHVVMPEVSRETRARLAARLTEVFATTAGFDPQLFGIYFSEYPPQQTSMNGRLWDGQSGPPFLHFVLYCPRVGREVKRALVEEFTEAFSTCLAVPGWKPVVHICEHPYDNIGVDGALLSDAYEECANRPFYYSLSEDGGSST
jgi:phenylpyruvate tautomerase PptA (4-oxalocrotonate tautomerase family)